MLQDIELPFHPSTTNCLAWNQDDGQLALAAGEYVHILVPNYHRRNEKAQYGSPGPWVHVHIRINLFTFEEWPSQEPASFEDLSLGEEQSLSTVTNLSWSEPGLAKHRRSVLTVLTSNLVLSLWESASDPRESSSWRRILVVNNILREYFTTPGTSDGTIRKRKRIRAAAWAHGSRLLFSKDNSHILAVTNDYREVAFLRIRMLYDLRDPCDQKLQVEILLCLSDLSKSKLESDPTIELQNIAQHGPANSERRKILMSRRVAGSIHRLDHDVTWSPWKDVDGTIQAMITCRNHSSVRHYLLHYEGPRLEKVEHHDEPSSDGPIIWISSDASGHAFVCGTRNAIEMNYYQTISRMKWKNNVLSAVAKRSLPSLVDRWERDIYGGSNSQWYHPWDIISGLVTLKNNSGDEDLIVLATHLSHVEIYSLNADSMPKILTDGTALVPREEMEVLRAEMARCRSHFAFQRKLTYETTVMKTWGLAKYGGIVAACVTMHPSDMVEYTIPSVEQATVLFSDQAFEPTSFDWEKVQEGNPPAFAYQATWDIVFSWPIPITPADDSLGRRIMYNHICASMLLYQTNTEDPMPRCNTALKDWWPTGISLELIMIEQPLPAYMHDCLKLLLAPISESEASTTSQKLAMLNNWVQQRSTAEESLPRQQRLVETCSIAGCGSPLLWDSNLNARCTDGQSSGTSRGHRWRRCALTFLAIQEPGISKYCEVCGREYLNDEKLFAGETSFKHMLAPVDSEVNIPLESDGDVYILTEPDVNHNDRKGDQDAQAKVAEKLDQSLPLARRMFKHFSKCVFCDGKFIG